MNYVILTGSKNNSGDFLIKYQAKKIFTSLRPERNIIDINAFEHLSHDKLDIINSSKLLILMGGPSLQTHMYPNIYKLTKNLNDIEVPIVTMGIGYKDYNYYWEGTKSYELSDQTIKLLDKISDSNYLSSVRDYSTLNVLKIYGYKNYLMTGCPALYETNFIENNDYLDQIKKIRFSIGVNYKISEAMCVQMKNLITNLQKYFFNTDFKVLFHHQIKSSQGFLIDWLRKNNIQFLDVSGSAEKMIQEYESSDIHIGYRVHAHIFMSSINKPSILISEDSRAKGLSAVIGGLNFDGYLPIKFNLINKILLKLKLKSDIYIPVKNISRDVINHIEYEKKFKWPCMEIVNNNIHSHYKQMKNFINQLP